ncbi:hypothetical protein Poly51_29420 [Rubripirellula tenax]|uniref:Uncharacterized protein n=1 Tax=Rubripirellula tenax TaxID=2528015 RepID=A0A5C6FBL4_9BACT|nr:hypothetical protein [Rubripirellula tenax]TWU57021.1 hypothetical protein Poly51_29420 [Rubripirellula tenax]
MDDQTDEPIEATVVEARIVEEPAKFLDNKWAVIAILFAVTGFLGIPLLWMNKSFSTLERVFWSIVVTIYTLLLLAGAAAVCMWSYRQITGG